MKSKSLVGLLGGVLLTGIGCSRQQPPVVIPEARVLAETLKVMGKPTKVGVGTGAGIEVWMHYKMERARVGEFSVCATYSDAPPLGQIGLEDSVGLLVASLKAGGPTQNGIQGLPMLAISDYGLDGFQQNRAPSPRCFNNIGDGFEEGIGELRKLRRDSCSAEEVAALNARERRALSVATAVLQGRQPLSYLANASDVLKPE